MEEQDVKNPLEPLLEQLKLDIKGVMLLSDREESVSKLDIVRGLSESEPSVQKFISILREGSEQRVHHLVLTAIGQFLVSAFLFSWGIFIIFPALYPKFSTEQFLSYYASGITYTGKITGFYEISIILSFLLAVFLLISAFFTIRVAQNSIGLVTK